jgi:hypothetical protein
MNTRHCNQSRLPLTVAADTAGGIPPDTSGLMERHPCVALAVTSIVSAALGAGWMLVILQSPALP